MAKIIHYVNNLYVNKPFNHKLHSNEYNNYQGTNRVFILCLEFNYATYEQVKYIFSIG